LIVPQIELCRRQNLNAHNLVTSAQFDAPNGPRRRAKSRLFESARRGL
jgi:hypothetical protein